MVNKEDRFNNKRFKEVLAKYEAGQDNLDSLFFDVDDIMDIAEYYNYKADVDNARKAVAFAAHLYPTSPMVLILQARMALFSDFDIDKARHYAQLIEQQGCEDMEYFYLKAEMLLFEDYIYEADSYLESKIPLLDGEDLEDFYLDVAFIFLDYRLPEYAKAWLDRSNEKDDPDYLEAEGRIAFLMEDYDKCETIFKKLLENEPFAVPLWNTLSSAQFLNGRLVESIDSSEYAIAISPNNPEALLNKARCLSTAYRFSEAAEFYERYLTQVPNDSSVRAMYGVALIAYGKYDEALSNLYQAKDTCTDKSLIPEIVKQLVFVLSKKGQTDEAFAVVDEAEKNGHIDHLDRLLNEGRLFLDIKEKERAGDRFVEAILESKHSMGIYMEVAIAYYVNDAFFETIKTLTSALFYNPREKRGYAYLADSYRQYGMKQEFLDTLKLACENNPLEVKEVMCDMFPIDMDPRDFYDYALKKFNGDKPADE